MKSHAEVVSSEPYLSFKKEFDIVMQGMAGKETGYNVPVLAETLLSRVAYWLRAIGEMHSRNDLVQLALFLSPVWEADNADDVAAANEAVETFLLGEKEPTVAIPREFWREVPCGHPPDPVAMKVKGGWVCHCGNLLTVAEGIQVEDAPGPVVQCSKCGCHVAIPVSPPSP